MYAHEREEKERGRMIEGSLYSPWKLGEGTEQDHRAFFVRLMETGQDHRGFFVRPMEMRRGSGAVS